MLSFILEDKRSVSMIHVYAERTKIETEKVFTGK